MRIATFLAGLLCLNTIANANANANGFRDDFNNLNSDYWYVTRVDGNWNSDVLNYDAVDVSDGIITLLTDRTDDGPILTSKAIEVSHGDIVTIRRKVYVHADNRYYSGGLHIFSTEDSSYSSTANADKNKALCGIAHYDYTYQGDWNAFILGDRNDSSNFITPLWDEWLEEELIYNTETGLATYSANGETVTTQCERLNTNYIKVRVAPYGWWTGHFEKMDYFEVLINEGSHPNAEEQETLVATPEVYINTNSQNIFKDEMLQVFFNTSILAGMSEHYDVYFSINWADITLYDNGVDLITDKQPLFNNIVVPELSNWFEYQKLRYTFPEGVPQTDYVLGLHLVDSEDNVIFENFSSVSYFPEQSPFTSANNSKQQAKAKTTASITRQARSSSKKCHLGGIRTSIENTAVTELDKATKRSMLALQMGSSFPLEGRLKTLYQGVKGSYNLLKKGKKVCDHVNNFETLFDNYDDNIDFYGLSNEQASNIFAIEMLTSALSLTSGGGVLYSGFDSNDLVNGIKDYYNYQNKQFSTISSLDNSATIKIKFEQPSHWFLFIPYSTDAVELKVTATPVFTYEDGYEFTNLKDVPKNFTDLDNIETKSVYLGKADSDRTSFGNIDYILSATLTRGLYLIKASTENGDEVFRDTIHVMSEGQEHTMLIDR